ncbi:cytoskeleton-associated protein 2 [Eleutherodactylus coqui]|uniref:cytoskeleton-associated protein 2 n=1 Tax=Eleutherodactylus coqui TaxID=57060 RepID=UPI0034628553
MSGAKVQPLPQSRSLQPDQREERRRRPEVLVAKKAVAQKPRAADRPPDIRFPLMERSNRALQRKPKEMKPSEKKMVESVNKENIRPAVNKDDKSGTFSQTFLKTRTLKEKQTKDEKVKLEATKEKPKPPTKPVFGAYRGIIVQSKINSIWKNSESKNQSEQNKTLQKRDVKRPQTSASLPVKTAVKPSNDAKPKRPVIPSAPSQIRPSTTLAKSKAEPVTVQRITKVRQQRAVQQKAQAVKPPLKNVTVKNNPVTQSKTNPVETLADPRKNKPAPQPPTARKFPKAKESAEERKARLAEWRQSKGKVTKRPPMAVVKPVTSNVQKEEPVEQKEETRQLYWAAMAEEDEQEWFTLKVHQIFRDCKKLIEEGCPKVEVLSILEKQIETAPEVTKLSAYWECRACLERRDGQLYKVIAVCEEAVSAGVQPLEELRAILADALQQLKPDPEEKDEDLESAALSTEVVDEPAEAAVQGKRGGKSRAVTSQPKSPSSPGKLPGSESTPVNEDAVSSVIRFNVRSTPQLERIKKLQMNEGDSSIKSYKFLTPVRRSSRLERKTHRLPDMLKDHDPCVSGIDELGNLEDTEDCAHAYIFRKNSALNDITAKSAAKK